jgi:hypothetical protein
MYCKSGCQNGNDQINVVIKNENERILANEYYIYRMNEYSKKIWMQKLIKINNEAKNLNVKNNLFLNL